MKISLFLLFCLLVNYFQANIYGQDLSPGKMLYARCEKCHGNDGFSNDEAKSPKLAGQFSFYIEKQLLAYKQGFRDNEDKKSLLKDLNEADIKDLGAYV